MDNDRPIEKLLRDYAKKRRADAGEPPGMHPATRRMLQGEVSRQFPKARHGGSFFTQFISRWRPGFVYALCALAVVAVSVPLLLPTFQKKGSEARHAKATPDGESADKKLAPPTPSAVVAPEADKSLPAAERERANEAAQALAFKDNALTKQDPSAFRFEEEKQKSPPARTLTADALAQNAPATPPSAPQIASRDLATLEAQSKLERSARETRPDAAGALPLETRRTVAEAPAALAGEKLGANRAAQPPIATDSPAGVALAARSPSVVPMPSATAPVLADSTGSAFSARYGLPKSAAVAVVQRFRQTQATGDVRPSTGADAGAAPVLATFQLEQAGDQLRVIDSDGSTYTGAITSPVAGRYYGATDERKGATALAAGGKGAVPTTSSPADSNPQAGQNYYFRVAGTNRTLQQPVVLTGNILILTNVLPAGQTAVAQPPAARSQQQLAPAQNQPPSLRNATISGNVQLGTNRESPIHAVPADR